MSGGILYAPIHLSVVLLSKYQTTTVFKVTNEKTELYHRTVCFKGTVL
jgi:hypothetical protein